MLYVPRKASSTFRLTFETSVWWFSHVSVTEKRHRSNTQIFWGLEEMALEYRWNSVWDSSPSFQNQWLEPLRISFPFTSLYQKASPPVVSEFILFNVCCHRYFGAFHASTFEELKYWLDRPEMGRLRRREALDFLYGRILGIWGWRKTFVLWLAMYCNWFRIVNQLPVAIESFNESQETTLRSTTTPIYNIQP